jgi:hypothetical protein
VDYSYYVLNPINPASFILHRGDPPVQYAFGVFLIV